MLSAVITTTTRKPKPPEADFAFCIDFIKGEGSASRVFTATSEFIKACEEVDRELVKSIDVNIEPVMVLEDVEGGSLKTYLRCLLKSVDDQALKHIDWKPLVGRYLVKAKYLVLEWCESSDQNKDIQELRQQIQRLAIDTDVRFVPNYEPVNNIGLLNSIRNFDSVKDHLVDGDKASMVLSDDEAAEFTASNRIDLESIENLAIRETVTHVNSNVILIVRKPDFLAESMWEFRQGQKYIDAKIEHAEWLRQFQTRRVVVLPGDAVRCRLRIDMTYGHDNELLGEKYYIEEVNEVLENQQSEQGNFGFDDSN